MARRLTPAQARAQIRQAQAKAKRAVSDYNAGVRKLNRAIDNHNQEIRSHNARVRANRERLRRELSRMKSSTTTTRVVTYRKSVVTFQQSFTRLEASGASGRLGEDLFEMSEGEAANSAAALNALLAEPDSDAQGHVDELRATGITDELAVIDPDLDHRWRGALFSLHPENPDAARHFCTSARELLARILESAAPDDAVLVADPACPRTPQGSVSRRARIRYCIATGGTPDSAFEEFIDADIDNVIDLFDEFNKGTHGSAGRFAIGQLAALKNRVEDAIKFLHRIINR